MIAAVPRQGGATWAILQYLLGFRELGHDVTFVEPVDGRVEAEQIRYCAAVMSSVGLDDRWALVRADGSTIAGLDDGALARATDRADVLFNVSGMLTHPRVLEAVDVRVYLDLDPAFVQMWHAYEGVDMRLDGHTHFVSLSDVIGVDGGVIPSCGRAWIPTLPPVVLGQWPYSTSLVHDAWTTVGHWRGYGSIHRDGVTYGQKAHSLRQLFPVPQLVDDRFLLALGIHPDESADLASLRTHGWELVDPARVTSTPDDYRAFVQHSRGELAIAKSGYVLSGSGWFSDRSACYLASGRPVVAQDTGFGRRLPTGVGLFACSDAADLVAAVDEVRRDPERHRLAAREVAVEYLASDRVLRRLLDLVAS